MDTRRRPPENLAVVVVMDEASIVLMVAMNMAPKQTTETTTAAFTGDRTMELEEEAEALIIVGKDPTSWGKLQGDLDLPSGSNCNSLPPQKSSTLND